MWPFHLFIPRGTSTLPCTAAASVHAPTDRAQGSPFLLYLLSLVCDGSHSHRCEEVSHWLWFAFLATSDAERVFTHLVGRLCVLVGELSTQVLCLANWTLYFAIELREFFIHSGY